MSRWGKPIKNKKRRDPRYFLNESVDQLNESEEQKQALELIKNIKVKHIFFSGDAALVKSIENNTMQFPPGRVAAVRYSKGQEAKAAVEPTLTTNRKPAQKARGAEGELMLVYDDPFQYYKALLSLSRMSVGALPTGFGNATTRFKQGGGWTEGGKQAGLLIKTGGGERDLVRVNVGGTFRMINKSGPFLPKELFMLINRIAGK